MIRGIQIKGKINYINIDKTIVYITDFEEMTVDTDRENRIITSDELEDMIKGEK